MNHSLCGQVLRGVEEFLTQHEVSFSSLVINALQDPESPLAGELISKITDVLEALRPHLDAGTIIELGRFFASLASSELSKLGKHKLWHLPATTLSADELEEFSVAEMSRQIATLAPRTSALITSSRTGFVSSFSGFLSSMGLWYAATLAFQNQSSAFSPAPTTIGFDFSFFLALFDCGRASSPPTPTAFRFRTFFSSTLSQSFDSTKRSAVA